MKYNRTKGFQKEAFAVKTSEWSRYGAHLSGDEGFYTALLELVTNAVDAAVKVPSPRVSIEISNGRIVVEDNGGMSYDEMKNAMQYGTSTHKGRNNEYGTGLKTAFSFFAPDKDGGDFEVCSSSVDGTFVIKAPYCAEMTIEGPVQWPFASWAKTHIKTGVSIDIPDMNDIKEHLELYLTGCIREGVYVELNGEKLDVYEPSDEICHGGALKPKKIKIYDELVSVSWTTYLIPEGERHAATQGVHVYYNGRYISHEKLKLIHLKNGEGYYKGIHNAFNKLVTLLFITNETGKHKLPLNSCKTAINWTTPAGKLYRDQISELIRKPYDDVNVLTEKVVEDTYANIINAVKVPGFLKDQVFIDASRKLRPDAVVIRMDTPDDAAIAKAISATSGYLTLNEDICGTDRILQIIEFKNFNKTITGRELGQVMEYLEAFEEAYGYRPNAIIVGKDITVGARRMADKAGIEFKDLEFIRVLVNAKVA